MLFGHAWALHTISTAQHRGWADKQTLFWPYILTGLAAQSFWWHSLGAGEGAIRYLEVVPILLQYAGRWGLYLRLRALLGDALPTDAFEARKQGVELATFSLALLGVVLFTAAAGA